MVAPRFFFKKLPNLFAFVVPDLFWFFCNFLSFLSAWLNGVFAKLAKCSTSPKKQLFSLCFWGSEFVFACFYSFNFQTSSEMRWSKHTVTFKPLSVYCQLTQNSSSSSCLRVLSFRDKRSGFVPVATMMRLTSQAEVIHFGFFLVFAGTFEG